jgi:uncharacterized membrane protein
MNVIQKGVVLPTWLEEPEYQEFLLQAIPIIEKILNTVEAIENQIQLAPENNRKDTVLLAYEWELRQQIIFLHLMIQKGYNKPYQILLKLTN